MCTPVIPNTFLVPEFESESERENTMPTTKVSTSAAPRFETSDTDGASESETWKTRNKKRQRTSPEDKRANLKQSKINQYWLSHPITTSNRFTTLESQVDNTSVPTEEKVVRPPPIFVDKVANIQPLVKLLNDTVNNQYEIKVLRDEQVKIQPKTKDAYSVIVKELEKKQTEFYTYKPKSERSFKVVLKNMHPTTDMNELKNSIEELGHSVVSIWNVQQRVTKKPLPIFFIDIKPDSTNKTIYNVKSLLNCKITFEPPRPKREVPQCANCQQYGHTKKFCRRLPKCVKCAGDHLTANCPRKEKSNTVKCVLCGGNHPANYKGCSVYREIQKTAYPKLRTKAAPKVTEKTAVSAVNTTGIRRNYSFAQAVQGNTNNASTQQTSPPNNDLLDMLKQLMVQMTTMTNLVSNIITSLSTRSTP
jgi:hypothetical protein